jgi:hypothetical protein
VDTTLPRRRRRLGSAGLLALLLLVAATAATARAQRGVEPAELAVTLAKASARVEAYFTRAQSLVCTETVHLQPLNYGLSGDGMGRTVESELRLSWDAGIGGEATGEAQTRRQVVKVNGRPPRPNDRNNCTAPEQHETEPQPLSMLLASERDNYAFSPAGRGRVDKREAVMIDFRQVEEVKVDVQQVEGNDDCISYDLTGGLRGRLWIDAETADVLRLDQRLAGQVEVRLPRALARRPGVSPTWTLERWDTTMRFKRVTFDEPQETLVLPVSTTVMRVTRGSGSPRLRTTTTYSRYKRFLTGGRIVGDGPS